MRSRGLLPAALALLLSACATSYHPIRVAKPSLMQDRGTVSAGCVIGDFQKNKRINSKARNHKIEILHCRVRNGSPETVTGLTPLAIPRASGDTVRILSVPEAYRKLAFIEGGYLLYAQPFGVLFSFSDQGNNIQFGIKDPLSLILGLVWGGYNWSLADKSNDAFISEMDRYDLTGGIRPGDSTQGLVFVRAPRGISRIDFAYAVKGIKDTLRVDISAPLVETAVDTAKAKAPGGPLFRDPSRHPSSW